MSKTTREDSTKKLSFFGRISFFLKVVTILFYLGFVAVKLITKSGIEWINYLMLTATIIYLLFFLITFKMGAKNTQKTAKKTYKNFKRVLLLINALLTLMLVFTSKDGNPILTIVLSIFTILNLLVQMVVDAIVNAISKRLSKRVQTIKEKTSDVKQYFKNRFQRPNEEETN